MSSKLGKSTVWTGDDSDMFGFYGHLTSSDVSEYDGLFTETIDASERSYDSPKVETPTSGLLVTGTERDDTLYGSELNDEIHGLAGNDRIDAGGGNDLLFGGAGNDTMYGGAGVDTLSYAFYMVGINVSLWQGTVVSYHEGTGEHVGEDHTHLIETDTLHGIERIIGTDYDDYFSAWDDGGYFDGGGGDDTILGASDGTSVLLGGGGDDWLSSGGGATWMTGGDGSDEFSFTIHAASTVTDFTPGVDTIWDVAARHEDDLPLGRDWALATGTELPTARNADGDALFYDTDNYALYELWYDDDGQIFDTFLLATFANGIQLQTSDFVFV